MCPTKYPGDNRVEICGLNWKVTLSYHIQQNLRISLSATEFARVCGIVKRSIRFFSSNIVTVYPTEKRSSRKNDIKRLRVAFFLYQMIYFQISFQIIFFFKNVSSRLGLLQTNQSWRKFSITSKLNVLVSSKSALKIWDLRRIGFK